MIDKEETLSLRQVRLKELQQAANCIVIGDGTGAFNRLKNFADSIDEDSLASKGLLERFKEIEKKYFDGYDTIESEVLDARQGSLRINGIPHFEYEPVEKKRVYNEFIRRFNRICWQIALRHDLIPKQ